MTPRKLSKILGIKITIEPIRKCWFIRKDWSIYATIKGKRAHRISYELYRGPLIEGMFICHHCDRKGCVNPRHLFQGTHADNMQDAMNKYKVKSPFKGLIMNKRMSELRKADQRKQVRSGRLLNAHWNRN